MNFPPQESPEITVHELAELRQNNGDASFRLVDCREEDEFAICRIENAELIPLSTFAEKAPGKLIGEGSLPVIVYCHHGMRSLQATQFLRSRGLAEVWSLAGGIDLWSREIDSEVARY